jgi:hypothetical protein
MIHAERRRRWDYGPGLWGCCFGPGLWGCGPWRRRSRREETEELKDYISELKEALQDAEERLMQRQSHVDLGRRLGSSLYFGLIDWVPSIAQ